MLTKCEDATIKVRRLVHNFEERMKDTQEQVWDENYNLRPDFDFKDISIGGLRDVILLHDWWAANAPGVHPKDMGMTDEEFDQFRRRCNKISYNLRKNQYSQLISVRIDRTRNRISELEDIIADKDTLHWDDKYGWEAKKDDGEEVWTVEKANAKARERIRLLAMAKDIIDEVEESGSRMVSPTQQTLHKRKVSNFVDVELEDEDNSNRLVESAREDVKKRKVSSFVDVELEDEDNSNRLIVPTKQQVARRKLTETVVSADATYRECAKLEKQYKEDSKKLVERTMEYLKYLGLVETEADLERLATANAASKRPELSQRWLSEIQGQRERLDSSIELMQRHRKNLQSILDNVAKMEAEIKDLQSQNKRIYATCARKRFAKGVERAARDRMLMDKLDNEQRILELKSLVKKAKTKHLQDFTALENMRKDVDDTQAEYDDKVSQFKREIGLTTDAIDNLMVGIYNKFQDEILERNKRKQK